MIAEKLRGHKPLWVAPLQEGNTRRGVN